MGHGVFHSRATCGCGKGRFRRRGRQTAASPLFHIAGSVRPVRTGSPEFIPQPGGNESKATLQIYMGFGSALFPDFPNAIEATRLPVTGDGNNYEALRCACDLCCTVQSQFCF